jgi:uncharacterized protein YfdQ (DUF2303 family)
MEENVSDFTSAAAIIRDLAHAQGVRQELLSGSSAYVYSVHKDFHMEVMDMERYRDAPSRIREKVTFLDRDAFVSYVKDFATPGSRIFFDSDHSQFVAVLDYSQGPNSPAWGDHVATYVLQLSEEWKLWYAGSSAERSQVSFGRFIEENLVDIVQPDGASLLEMVMSFEATKSVAFREATRLRNGQVQFTYSEEIKTGTVEIPDSVFLRIPVYKRQAPTEVQVRFRYRIAEQKLLLRYEIVRAQRVIDSAAQKIVDEVRSLCGIPLHIGTRSFPVR